MSYEKASACEELRCKQGLENVKVHLHQSFTALIKPAAPRGSRQPSIAREQEEHAGAGGRCTCTAPSREADPAGNHHCISAPTLGTGLLNVLRTISAGETDKKALNFTYSSISIKRFCCLKGVTSRVGETMSSFSTLCLISNPVTGSLHNRALTHQFILILLPKSLPVYSLTNKNICKSHQSVCSLSSAN